MFPNTLIQRLMNAFVPDSTANYSFRTIDNTLDLIHKKKLYDFQKTFFAVADDAKLYFSIRPTTKNAHLVVTITAEGKSLFKSYADTTWTSDGTKGTVFNRYINDAPIATTDIYYGGVPNVIGTMRFDELIIGGVGPRSTGGSSGSRTESILDFGHTLTIEIENVSGQAKDYGVTIEWYEE